MSEELKTALEDIDAYLETMPAKTDDWSIGYEAITPFVKSLRLLREQFEGRGDVISELLTELDTIGELVELKDGESISAAIESLFAALESENERLKETALTKRQAEHILRIKQARAHWFQPTCLCDECTDTYGVLLRISSTSEETS